MLEPEVDLDTDRDAVLGLKKMRRPSFSGSMS
jgi:hypothetical protein